MNIIPADVPQKNKEIYLSNYQAITHNTRRLFLFSCDQKIEHLHDDFRLGDQTISSEAINPEHFFRIAEQGRIGALAIQLELIARYGAKYTNIPYIVKLNSKTNLIDANVADPISAPLYTVEDVVSFKAETNFAIHGIGITIYPGSMHEAEMMNFASQMILDAHNHGLVAILWMYPRGKSIVKENDPHLLAGVAGAANALGADFVKIKAPDVSAPKNVSNPLQEIVAAAGNTGVLISGGSKKNSRLFLDDLYQALTHGHIAGAAVGRNIFQHSLATAVQMTKAISALVYDDTSLNNALEYINKL